MKTTRTKKTKFNLQITCESSDESAAIYIALDDLRKQGQKELKIIKENPDPKHPDRAEKYASEIAMISKMLKQMDSPE